MERSEIYKIVEEEVRKFTFINESDEISPNASLINELGYDSLDLVELVMNLEHRFNISISDDDWDKLDTPNNITEYISSIV